MSSNNEGKDRRKPTYRFDELNGDQRLGEMILYVAERCEEDPTFGATKLNKILWRADFLAYARHNEPITGAEYRKAPQGPVPVRLVQVRNALLKDAAVTIQERRYYSKVQLRVIPLRKANRDLFTDRQLDVVDELIDEFWGQLAIKVSEDSHGKAWEGREMGQSIPYQAIFLSDDPNFPSDVRRTHELAEQHGWERV